MSRILVFTLMLDIAGNASGAWTSICGGDWGISTLRRHAGADSQPGQRRLYD